MGSCPNQFPRQESNIPVVFYGTFRISPGYGGNRFSRQEGMSSTSHELNWKMSWSINSKCLWQLTNSLGTKTIYVVMLSPRMECLLSLHLFGFIVATFERCIF